MRILVVNTGSSSLKLRVLGGDGLGDDSVTAELDIERWEGEHDVGELERVVAEAGSVDAVGHRVVHGGADLTGPTLVSEDVESRIAGLASLAPLHQPRALSAIRATRRLMPGVPHVACFDTAFHATLPPAASTYALPSRWRDRWGVRRFGFHGVSHAWTVRHAPEVADTTTGSGGGRRVISCHLGAGASLCAARDGRSVDTTMGFTPLEGLVMATRAGSVDPGLVLWLIRDAGLSPDDVANGLEHDGGLRGLTGTSGDMRDVLAARAAGDRVAAAGYDVYVHRLRRDIGAMAATLGGVDILAFTGGVGEHASEVRADAVAGLRFLGLVIDGDRNRATTGDGDVTGPGAESCVVVVTAREDLEIARQVRQVVRPSTP